MGPTAEPPVLAPVAMYGRDKGTAATTSAQDRRAGLKLKSGVKGAQGANLLQ